jgi:heat shock protein HslJ
MRPRRHRPARRRALLGALAAGLAACATTGAPGAADPLVGPAWHLVEVAGRPALPAGDLGPSFVRFEADSGVASGNGGCNRMRGPYTRDGDALRIGPLIATRRACIDEDRNRQETDFLGALETTQRYAIGGDTLTLFGDGDGALARLVAREGEGAGGG